ncbi:major facilitator superfamily domain-containing protein [Fennellomyces sp. T-0311]|nr:major facilitator superfamily domain-containing protein [Fennellomyces sp. T-0311]
MSDKPPVTKEPRRPDSVLVQEEDIRTISPDEYQHKKDDIKSRFSRTEVNFIVSIVCASLGLSSVGVFIYVPSISTIISDLNTTASLTNATMSCYRLVQAFSPTLWGSLSELWGRRPAYMAVIAISAVACVGLALTPTIWCFFIFRMFHAFGSTSIHPIGCGVIGEVSIPSERAGYIAIYSASQRTFSLIGPVLGGVIGERLSWRWDFWILLIIGAVLLIFITLFMPETLRHLMIEGKNPTIFQWIQRKRQQKLDQPKVHEKSREAYSENTGKSRFLQFPDLSQPFRYLAHLDLLLIIILHGINSAINDCFMITLQDQLHAGYGLSQQQIGFTFFGQSTGCIIGGIVTGPVLNGFFRRVAKRYNPNNACDTLRQDRVPIDFPIHHARLFPVTLTLILSIMITVLNGWAFHYHVHLAIAIAIQFCAGFCFSFVIAATNTLLLDLCPGKGASAIAALNLLKCSLR